MTDRKKLIKLLEDAPIDPSGNRNVGVIADHLLAHGVTFHKPGHWKHRKSWDKYVCSECGFEHDEPHNYCPNPKCNAKMECE